MKRYIHIALIALVAQCGLSNVLYAMKITPTNIKQYSHLTEADENQWKILWLGRLGTAGAFIAGAASVVGAGVGTYQRAGAVQSITPQAVPGWMTNPVVLAGFGSLGAGYVSYKTLYPRIKAGVLNKVQRFIDVCEALQQDSPFGGHTIVNWNFPNLYELKQSYLPKLWVSESDVAIWNALSNLEEQGKTARKLLVQIGLSDSEIERKYNDIGLYTAALSHNRQLYEWLPAVQQKKNEQQYKKEQERKDRQDQLKEQRDIAELAGIEAGTSLMKAKTIETYAGMATGAVRNIWKGAAFLYENKEYIMGAAASVGLMSAYSYVQSKLGYGQ